MSNDKITLTYWPVQGLGAAARIALIHAVGIDGFVDEQMTSLDEFNAKRDCLTATENAMLNLPYIKFPGERAVAQSNAVLMSIGRRYNLCGKSQAEMDSVQEVLLQFADFITEYAKLSYMCPKDKFEEYHADFNRETIPYYFGGFDKLLKICGGKPFLCGESLSVADIAAYCYVYTVSKLNKHESTSAAVAQYPNLKAMVERIEEMPCVQTYRSHPMGKLPLNGHVAHWNFP